LLCAESAPVTLEEIRFPDPVIVQAIIPDRTTDETKLADALAKLVRDDPTLKMKTDPETKQLIFGTHPSHYTPVREDPADLRASCNGSLAATCWLGVAAGPGGSRCCSLPPSVRR
jgi:hypothetical protein